MKSSEFEATARERRFLSHVVEETLAGRSARIKAYSIAVEVFGRDASFDAQTDPIVRIEAGHLRRSLERYYLTAGRDDAIVITIPKGGYVPVFAPRDRQTATAESAGGLALPSVPAQPGMPRWIWPLAAVLLVLLIAAGDWLSRRPDQVVQTADVTTAVPDVPRLLVLPFEDLSGTRDSKIIARGLTDEVIGQMARFKDIVVMVGRPGEPNADAIPVARYALQGSLRTDAGSLRLSARLVNTADGSVVWVNDYDARFRAHELIETERQIARDVATAVARPYGIIFRADAASVSDTAPDDWEAYACTLAYYSYRSRLDPAEHVSVRVCLERAVAKFPTYATGWALLSLTYIDELRFRYRTDEAATPPLERALEAAGRAVELDPDNVRGLQAQMTALFFSKDVEAALAVGARAIAINPNDTELVGEYGARLALSGEWKRGREILESVVARSPDTLGYYETTLALSFYMQRDYRSAAEWIRKASVVANPIYHVVAAAIFGQSGDASAAAIEREWLMKNAPEVVAEIDHEMAMRNMRPNDQLHVVDGLRKAGLVIASF